MLIRVKCLHFHVRPCDVVQSSEQVQLLLALRGKPDPDFNCGLMVAVFIHTALVLCNYSQVITGIYKITWVIY